MPKFSSARMKTLSSISRSSIHQSLATPASQAAMARARAAAAGNTDPTAAMEMMRSLLQKSINEEIKKVLDKYTEKFFGPGYRNAVANIGEENVNDRLVENICISTLEHAKDMYLPQIRQRPAALPGVVSLSGTSDNRARDLLISSQLKRKAPSLAPTANPPNPTPQGPGTSAVGQTPLVPKKKKKKKSKKGDKNGDNDGKPARPNTDLILVSKTGKPVRREGPLWDPERFDRPGMMFILGSRANKALGYGQTRGRLYIKHPEIFKYSGDQEDKEWLAKRGLMSTTGGKAYLMILSDILDLAASPDYVKHPRAQPQELAGFALPKFMTDKMKCFMGHLRTHAETPEAELLAYAERKFAVWEEERKGLSGFATVPDKIEKPEKKEEEMYADFRDQDVDEEEKKKVQEILNEIKKEETRLNPVSAANPALDTAALPPANPTSNQPSTSDVVDLGFLHGMNLNNLVREFEEMGSRSGEGHLSGILSLADDETAEVVGFPEFHEVHEDEVQAEPQNEASAFEAVPEVQNVEPEFALPVDKNPQTSPSSSGHEPVKHPEEVDAKVKEPDTPGSRVTTRAGSSKSGENREPLKITDSSNSELTEPIEDLNQLDFA